MIAMLLSRWPFEGLAHAADGRMRRAILLFASIGLHLLALLLLLSLDTRLPTRLIREGVPNVLTLTSPDTGGGGASRPSKPVPPTLVPPAPPAAAETAIATPPAPVGTGAASGPDGITGGCALAHDAAVAIARDAAAMTEVNALPSDARTSADAVMLWDGVWLASRGSAAPIAGGAVRRIVERIVTEAPTECRNAEARGPEFVPIPDGNRTIMIVIGSGLWHWGDLLVPPISCAPLALVPCSEVRVDRTTVDAAGPLNRNLPVR